MVAEEVTDRQTESLLAPFAMTHTHQPSFERDVCEGCLKTCSMKNVGIGGWRVSLSVMGYDALALASVVDVIVPSCLEPTPEPLHCGSITSVHDT